MLGATHEGATAQTPSRLAARAAGLACALAAAAQLAGCDPVFNSPRKLSDYAGNTLFTSFSGASPKTLDPQVSYSSNESIYTSTICEPPYTHHYLKRPYAIEPRTVEAVAAPAYFDAAGRRLPDGADGAAVASSVYTLRIKPGIYYAPHPAFARDAAGNLRHHRLERRVIDRLSSPLELAHDRASTRELTAHDYVYGIKRMASPRIVCPVLSLMAGYIPGLARLAKDLAGRPASGWLDLRGEALEGVRALDDRTLEITIRGKYPQFSEWLAMNFFAPVPWEAEAFYAQEGLAARNISLAFWPVGTGPYYLEASRQNREHVLARNPLYRRDPYPCEGEPGDAEQGLLADCGKPVPFIDRIVMTMEKESVPVASKFLQGYYDSPQVSRLDAGLGYIVAAEDSPEKARLYAERKLRFPKAVEANLWYLGFNWLDPVVGAGATPEQAARNRKLRQALSIAVDWEEQVAIFEKGQGEPAHGPVPPGLFGWRPGGPAAFNPVVYTRGADGRAVRRPIEDARRLMREAGYPDGRDAATGKPLVLFFDWQGAAPGSKPFLEWMARQFGKLGVQLEIRATDYNRFQDKMQRGAAQIYYWGWLADYPDAENFLFLLYGPNSKVAGAGGENASNYANAEYDRLFSAMKFMEDGPEKAAVIDRMVRIAQEDAVWSFGYFPRSAAALHHWVGNAKPTQIVRNSVQYLRIDAAERMKGILAWNRPVLWPLALVLGLAAAFAWGVAAHLRRRRRATGRQAP
ncbi:MAG: ABC transporter substrate-binding protein [Duodenibacillus sp.]|nr:ABC transporter substrate-binding protein [Duodenibacillus sp.]